MNVSLNLFFTWMIWINLTISLQNARSTSNSVDPKLCNYNHCMPILFLCKITSAAYEYFYITNIIRLNVHKNKMKIIIFLIADLSLKFINSIQNSKLRESCCIKLARFCQATAIKYSYNTVNKLCHPNGNYKPSDCIFSIQQNNTDGMIEINLNNLIRVMKFKYYDSVYEK